MKFYQIFLTNLSLKFSLMKKYTVFVLAYCFMAVSCNNSEKQTLLMGNWTGAQWLVGGNPSEYDAKQVHFTFTKDGYSSDFGGEKEKGTYYLRDNDLYTTPDGQMEIMVQIAKLTKDSVVFNMNRSGQAETLTLVKQ